jgi:hypothetical protein
MRISRKEQVRNVAMALLELSREEGVLWRASTRRIVMDLSEADDSPAAEEAGSASRGDGENPGVAKASSSPEDGAATASKN